MASLGDGVIYVDSAKGEITVQEDTPVVSRVVDSPGVTRVIRAATPPLYGSTLRSPSPSRRVIRAGPAVPVAASVVRSASPVVVTRSASPVVVTRSASPARVSPAPIEVVHAAPIELVHAAPVEVVHHPAPVAVVRDGPPLYPTRSTDAGSSLYSAERFASDPSVESEALRRRITDLELENRRLQKTSDADAVLTLLRCQDDGPARPGATAKYKHTVKQMGKEHVDLYDKLSAKRDDDYLKLLDKYEDAVGQITRLKWKLKEFQPMQKAYQDLTVEVNALKGQLQAAQQAQLVAQQQQSPQTVGTMDDTLPWDSSDVLWVALTPKQGKFMLDPNIPESNLSSGSASKVAAYAHGGYQTAMRRAHHGAGGGAGDEDLRAENEQLRRELEDLQRQLSQARLSRAPSAKMVGADPQLLAALQAELAEKDALLEAQREEMAKIAEMQAELQQYRDWWMPKKTLGEEKAAAAAPKKTGKRILPQSTNQHMAWQSELKVNEDPQQLYCMSEYGRILRDNEEAERRQEREHARRAKPTSQWAKWHQEDHFP